MVTVWTGDDSDDGLLLTRFELCAAAGRVTVAVEDTAGGGCFVVVVAVDSLMPFS